jgi:hypothetical protein
LTLKGKINYSLPLFAFMFMTDNINKNAFPSEQLQHQIGKIVRAEAQSMLLT